MAGIACHRTQKTVLRDLQKRASSSPALLSLVPLQGDVLRERPAPLRLDAQSGWSYRESVTTSRTRKTKTCIASSDLPGVLMLMTASLSGTVLNHCIEDNRCGRHVLDH